MTVVHRITGFDKESELIEREFDIPPDLVSEARRIAQAPPSWQEAPGAYPLDTHAVRALGRLLDVSIDFDRCDWFLEPVTA